MTNNNPLLEINNYGQSVWMDNLNRSLIKSGELEQQIEDYGLKGYAQFLDSISAIRCTRTRFRD